MKHKFISCSIVATLLCACLSLTAVFGQEAARSSTLQIAGLHGRVTIRRDERGIPYIEASNEDDLYFAQGYATASDRLWQMDLLRRNVRGELAEVLGQAALAQDQRHRTMGYAQVIDATAARMSPRMRAVLESYAKGVNAFIESRTSQNLPPEYVILQYKPRPWIPADSLAVGKLLYEVLSNTWPTDIMRAALANLPREKRDALLPEITPLDVLVVGKDRGPRARGESLSHPGTPPSSVLAKLAEITAIQQRAFQLAGFSADSTAAGSNLQASNNWVVSGKRTASGKPLLANDPHLPAFAPSIWYLSELVTKGSPSDLHVAGVTFPGAPGIVVGHNNRIAWGVTNLNPDVQDLYLEKFDKENPTRYATPSGWREAEVRHEHIKVRKGFGNTETETKNFDVTVTRHGPIVLEQDGARYALRWPALDSESVEFEGLYLINRARNWKDFTAALSHYSGPTQNFIYADVNGHIGYYGAGRIPVRKTGDGSVPYDGATDAGEWTGFIPFAKLPHSYDPPSGIIVTANQRVVGSDYPYFLTHYWAQPYRAHRIFELLSQKQKLTTDDFRRVQGDTYSFAGALFAREAVRAMQGQVVDDQMRASLASFASWDGRLEADSKVAPVVAQMRIAFRQRVLKAALGEQLFKTYVWPNSDLLIDRVVSEQPRDWLPKEFNNYPDLLRASYADARQALTKSLGADEAKWTWGAMSPARFTHPLSSAPFVGAQFTITPFPQSGTPFLLGATVNVGAGVSMRLIADPSNWDKTQQGLSLGQSGLPSSPHWKDQLDDWRAVKPREFPFTDAAVANATRETLILEPAK
ncbi:MAG: penicillin amidase [Blastocatellia bacterium]|jgi:penicillin amidase|nr:penicillin amidase [Blastocatellia bacterium]